MYRILKKSQSLQTLCDEIRAKQRKNQHQKSHIINKRRNYSHQNIKIPSDNYYLKQKQYRHTKHNKQKISNNKVQIPKLNEKKDKLKLNCKNLVIMISQKPNKAILDLLEELKDQGYLLFQGCVIKWKYGQIDHISTNKILSNSEQSLSIYNSQKYIILLKRFIKISKIEFFRNFLSIRTFHLWHNEMIAKHYRNKKYLISLKIHHLIILHQYNNIISSATIAWNQQLSNYLDRNQQKHLKPNIYALKCFEMTKKFISINRETLKKLLQCFIHQSKTELCTFNKNKRVIKSHTKQHKKQANILKNNCQAIKRYEGTLIRVLMMYEEAKVNWIRQLITKITERVGKTYQSYQRIVIDGGISPKTSIIEIIQRYWFNTATSDVLESVFTHQTYITIFQHQINSCSWNQEMNKKEIQTILKAIPNLVSFISESIQLRFKHKQTELWKQALQSMQLKEIITNKDKLICQNILSRRDSYLFGKTINICSKFQKEMYSFIENIISENWKEVLIVHQQIINCLQLLKNNSSYSYKTGIDKTISIDSGILILTKGIKLGLFYLKIDLNIINEKISSLNISNNQLSIKNEKRFENIYTQIFTYLNTLNEDIIQNYNSIEKVLKIQDKIKQFEIYKQKIYYKDMKELKLYLQIIKKQHIYKNNKQQYRKLQYFMNQIEIKININKKMMPYKLNQIVKEIKILNINIFPIIKQIENYIEKLNTVHTIEQIIKYPNQIQVHFEYLQKQINILLAIEKLQIKYSLNLNQIKHNNDKQSHYLLQLVKLNSEYSRVQKCINQYQLFNQKMIKIMKDNYRSLKVYQLITQIQNQIVKIQTLIQSLPNYSNLLNSLINLYQFYYNLLILVRTLLKLNQSGVQQLNKVLNCHIDTVDSLCHSNVKISQVQSILIEEKIKKKYQKELTNIAAIVAYKITCISNLQALISQVECVILSLNTLKAQPFIELQRIDIHQTQLNEIFLMLNEVKKCKIQDDKMSSYQQWLSIDRNNGFYRFGDHGRRMINSRQKWINILETILFCPLKQLSVHCKILKIFQQKVQEEMKQINRYLQRYQQKFPELCLYQKLEKIHMIIDPFHFLKIYYTVNIATTNTNLITLITKSAEYITISNINDDAQSIMKMLTEFIKQSVIDISIETLIENIIQCKPTIPLQSIFLADQLYLNTSPSIQLTEQITTIIQQYSDITEISKYHRILIQLLVMNRIQFRDEQAHEQLCLRYKRYDQQCYLQCMDLQLKLSYQLINSNRICMLCTSDRVILKLYTCMVQYKFGLLHESQSLLMLGNWIMQNIITVPRFLKQQQTMLITISIKCNLILLVQQQNKGKLLQLIKNIFHVLDVVTYQKEYRYKCNLYFTLMAPSNCLKSCYNSLSTQVKRSFRKIELYTPKLRMLILFQECLQKVQVTLQQQKKLRMSLEQFQLQHYQKYRRCLNTIEINAIIQKILTKDKSSGSIFIHSLLGYNSITLTNQNKKININPQWLSLLQEFQDKLEQYEEIVVSGGSFCGKSTLIDKYLKFYNCRKKYHHINSSQIFLEHHLDFNVINLWPKIFQNQLQKIFEKAKLSSCKKYLMIIIHHYDPSKQYLLSAFLSIKQICPIKIVYEINDVSNINPHFILYHHNSLINVAQDAVTIEDIILDKSRKIIKMLEGSNSQIFQPLIALLPVLEQWLNKLVLQIKYTLQIRTLMINSMALLEGLMAQTQQEQHQLLEKKQNNCQMLFMFSVYWTYLMNLPTGFNFVFHEIFMTEVCKYYPQFSIINYQQLIQPKTLCPIKINAKIFCQMNNQTFYIPTTTSCIYEYFLPIIISYRNIVLSGPSQQGKSTIIKHIISSYTDYSIAILTKKYQQKFNKNLKEHSKKTPKKKLIIQGQNLIGIQQFCNKELYQCKKDYYIFVEDFSLDYQNYLQYINQNKAYCYNDNVQLGGFIRMFIENSCGQKSVKNNFHHCYSILMDLSPHYQIQIFKTIIQNSCALYLPVQNFEQIGATLDTYVDCLIIFFDAFRQISSNLQRLFLFSQMKSIIRDSFHRPNKCDNFFQIWEQINFNINWRLIANISANQKLELSRMLKNTQVNRQINSSMAMQLLKSFKIHPESKNMQLQIMAQSKLQNIQLNNKQIVKLIYRIQLALSCNKGILINNFAIIESYYLILLVSKILSYTVVPIKTSSQLQSIFRTDSCNQSCTMYYISEYTLEQNKGIPYQLLQQMQKYQFGTTKQFHQNVAQKCKCTVILECSTSKQQIYLCLKQVQRFQLLEIDPNIIQNSSSLFNSILLQCKIPQNQISQLTNTLMKVSNQLQNFINLPSKINEYLFSLENTISFFKVFGNTYSLLKEQKTHFEYNSIIKKLTQYSNVNRKKWSLFNEYELQLNRIKTDIQMMNQILVKINQLEQQKSCIQLMIVFYHKNITKKEISALININNTHPNHPLSQVTKLVLKGNKNINSISSVRINSLNETILKSVKILIDRIIEQKQYEEVTNFMYWLKYSIEIQINSNQISYTLNEEEKDIIRMKIHCSLNASQYNYNQYEQKIISISKYLPNLNNLQFLQNFLKVCNNIHQQNKKNKKYLIVIIIYFSFYVNYILPFNIINYKQYIQNIIQIIIKETNFKNIEINNWNNKINQILNIDQNKNIEQQMNNNNKISLNTLNKLRIIKFLLKRQYKILIIDPQDQFINIIKLINIQYLYKIQQNKNLYQIKIYQIISSIIFQNDTVVVNIGYLDAKVQIYIEKQLQCMEIIIRVGNIQNKVSLAGIHYKILIVCRSSKYLQKGYRLINMKSTQQENEDILMNMLINQHIPDNLSLIMSSECHSINKETLLQNIQFNNDIKQDIYEIRHRELHLRQSILEILLLKQPQQIFTLLQEWFQQYQKIQKYQQNDKVLKIVTNQAFGKFCNRLSMVYKIYQQTIQNINENCDVAFNQCKCWIKQGIDFAICQGEINWKQVLFEAENYFLTRITQSNNGTQVGIMLFINIYAELQGYASHIEIITILHQISPFVQLKASLQINEIDRITYLLNELPFCNNQVEALFIKLSKQLDNLYLSNRDQIKKQLSKIFQYDENVISQKIFTVLILLKIINIEIFYQQIYRIFNLFQKQRQIKSQSLFKYYKQHKALICFCELDNYLNILSKIFRNQSVVIIDNIKTIQNKYKSQVIIILIVHQINICTNQNIIDYIQKFVQMYSLNIVIFLFSKEFQNQFQRNITNSILCLSISNVLNYILSITTKNPELILSNQLIYQNKGKQQQFIFSCSNNYSQKMRSLFETQDSLNDYKMIQEVFMKQFNRKNLSNIILHKKQQQQEIQAPLIDRNSKKKKIKMITNNYKQLVELEKTKKCSKSIETSIKTKKINQMLAKLTEIANKSDVNQQVRKNKCRLIFKQILTQLTIYQCYKRNLQILDENISLSDYLSFMKYIQINSSDNNPIIVLKCINQCQICYQNGINLQLYRIKLNKHYFNIAILNNNLKKNIIKIYIELYKIIQFGVNCPRILKKINYS